MHNATLGDKVSTLYYELFLNDTIRLGAGHRDVALGKYGIDTMRFGVAVPDSVLWSGRNPQSVRLKLKNRVEGRDVEFYDFPVALMQLSYDKGVFYINNQAENIEFAELSPASTLEQVQKVVDSGQRNIRFSAGCVADEILDYCDAEGVYVALTAPINSSSSGDSRRRGGNPSNNPKWRTDYIERTLQLYYTTKRHPSVVAYVLADDSSNGICLYESYLALKAVVRNRPVFYFDGSSEWNSDHLK
jgi:beta-galactosidase